MKFRKFLMQGSSFFFANFQTFALADSAVYLPTPNYVGVRPAALGQAFTAVADDQNALYYNPAGLARLPSWSLEVINPMFGFSTATKDNVTSLQELNSGGSGSSSNVDSVVDAFRDKFGKNNFIRAGLSPYFIKKPFGIGVFLDMQANLAAHDPAPSFFDLYLHGDSDVRFGYAHNFMGDKLSVGGSLSFRRRWMVAEELSYTDIFDLMDKNSGQPADKLKDKIKTGQGIGLDVGMLFTPVETLSPTLGLAVNNVGDLRFKEVSGAFAGGAPTNLPQSINIGASVKPTFGKFFVRPSVDFREVNLPTPASQKLALGVEGGLGNLVSTQLGYANGGISAGLEFRLYVINFRYATYAAERGYFPSQASERRHLIQVKILL